MFPVDLLPSAMPEFAGTKEYMGQKAHGDFHGGTATIPIDSLEQFAEFSWLKNSCAVPDNR